MLTYWIIANLLKPARHYTHNIRGLSSNNYRFCFHCLCIVSAFAVHTVDTDTSVEFHMNTEVHTGPSKSRSYRAMTTFVEHMGVEIMMIVACLPVCSVDLPYQIPNTTMQQNSLFSLELN